MVIRMSRRIIQESLIGLFAIGTVIVVILGLLLPFISSVSSFSNSLFNVFKEEFYFTITLFGTVYLLIKLISQSKISERGFLLSLTAITAVSFLARFIFALNYDQTLVSDFNTMWNRAIDIVENGWSSPYSPQTERPIAVFFPLVATFGSSAMVFKSFNVVAVTIQNILIALLCKKWFSNNAGIMAIFFLSLIPEFYFASLIPTHDIPGSLFLVIYIFVQFHFLDNYNLSGSFRKYALILLLCVSGLILEIQRNLFFLVCLSSLVYLFIELLLRFKESKGEIKLRQYIVVIIVPFVFVSLSKNLLIDNKILYDRNSESVIYNTFSSFCNTHSFSQGSYAACREFYNNYARDLEIEDVKHYTKAIMLSDIFYNHRERVENYLHRVNRLTQLGTQAGFYYGRLKNIDKREQIRINRLFSEINNVFVAVFSLIMVFALMSYVVSQKAKAESHVKFLFPVLLTGFSILIFGLMSENQPRYLFFCWPMWAILLVSFFHKDSERGINTLKFFIIDRTSLIVFGIIVSLVVLIFSVSMKNSDYKLVDMSTPTKISCTQHFDQSLCQNNIIQVDNDFSDKYYSTLRLQHTEGLYKNGAVKALYRVLVNDDYPHRVSLYVQSPYVRTGGNIGYFDVNIYVNGELRKTLHIAKTDENVFVSIDDVVPLNQTIDIEFEVRSNVNTKTASWRRASLVNFRFVSIRSKIREID